MTDSAQQEDRLVRIPIGFPPEVHEWLRETAFRRQIAMSQIVRDAVREYRERCEPQLSFEFGRAPSQ